MRDFHPLPYSPRNAGHPRMLNEKEPIGIAQAITPSATRSIVGRHYEAVLWTNRVAVDITVPERGSLI